MGSGDFSGNAHTPNSKVTPEAARGKTGNPNLHVPMPYNHSGAAGSAVKPMRWSGQPGDFPSIGSSAGSVSEPPVSVSGRGGDASTGGERGGSLPTGRPSQVGSSGGLK